MTAPSSWHEVLLGDVPRGMLEAVCERLWELGAAGVEERDPPDLAQAPRQPWDDGPAPPPPPRVDVRAWFEDADPATLADALADVAPGVRFGCELLPDTDWEAAGRDAFPRLPVTPTLAIGAPWNAEPGDVIIDPGVGFGTGHHPTTAAVLAALAERVAALPSPTVLDVGCGSGILALAAARLGARAVGIDVDADAVASARRNAVLSGLDVPFSTTPLAAVPGTYDVVLGNLHAEVLTKLAGDLISHTGQQLVLAGILEEKEAAVRAAFEPSLTLAERWHDPPWVALAYVRGR